MHTKQEVEDRRKAKRNNGHIQMLSVINTRKLIAKWFKQREFIGLHKESSSLAGPKDVDDVKITFPLPLFSLISPSLILASFPGESLYLVASGNFRLMFFQLQVR